MIQVEVIPYQLDFIYPFKLSHSTRYSTNSVFVKITNGKYTGLGEVAVPPYAAISFDEVVAQLKTHIPYQNINSFPEISSLIQKSENSLAAKCVLEMAYLDFYSKREKKDMPEVLGISSPVREPTSFTITYDQENILKEKIQAASNFDILKLKIGFEEEKQFLDWICNNTHKPFCVDVNQGWKTLEHGIGMAKWLKEKGCILIEQPFAKEDTTLTKALTEKKILPIIGDEAIQNLEDLVRLKEVFNGVNIKLSKCGGVLNALELAKKAKEFDFKIIVGCMSESSTGVKFGHLLSPYADWLDLDGPFLINNDPVKLGLI